jgi:HK97 family phage portal protein
VGIPSWAETMGQEVNRLSNGADAYARVPLVFRAVNIRCNSLASMPFQLYKGKNEIEWDETFQTPLKKLLWWTEAALLFKGQAFWLKLDSGTRRMGAQWLNPYTVTVKADQKKDEKGGVSLNLSFTQKVGSISLGPWTEEQIVFFKDFNPSNDATGGLSPVIVAMEDARLMHYMNRFTSLFFEGGAMPVTVLSVEGNPPQADIDRVRGYFERMASGIKNAFNVIGMRGGVKASTLTPRIDSLALPENRKAAIQDIAWAFGIPETMLTDAANYATATEQHRSYYSETVIPRGDAIAEAITNQFLKQAGMRLVADPEEMSMFQVDEAQRAGSLQQLTAAGIPLELAMDLLGYELSDEQKAMMEKEKTTSQPSTPLPTSPLPTEGERSVEGDSGKWMRKAMKALEKGKSADVAFETEEISEEMQEEIHQALKGCKSAEDVKGAFDGIKNPSLNPSPLRGEGGRDLVEELKAIRMALMEEETGEVKHIYEHEREGGTIKITQPDIVIPQPNITVNIPKDAIRVEVPPTVVNMPETVVNVTVPEQKAPVVNVTVPEQKAPVVNVNMPEESGKIVVKRDPKGKITEMRKE